MMVETTFRNSIMPARIFSPAKNAMQSGQAKSGKWILEFEPSSARKIEPLMGYTSSSDMNSQIRMEFASKVDAIAYAEKQGLDYSLPVERVAKKRAAMAYADNFSYKRNIPWTH